MGVEKGGSGGGPGSARRDRGGAQSVAFEGQVADEPGFSQLSHARRRAAKATRRKYITSCAGAV